MNGKGKDENVVFYRTYDYLESPKNLQINEDIFTLADLLKAGRLHFSIPRITELLSLYGLWLRFYSAKS